MSNISLVSADCPHMCMQAFRAAMPRKPPTLQPQQKSVFLTLLLFVEWVGLGAWQPCMLANTHVDSVQDATLFICHLWSVNFK